jgi:hypothetical protein
MQQQMDSDIYDRLIRELRKVERDWLPKRTSGVMTATSGNNNGMPPGILTVMGQNGIMPGVMRAMSEFEGVRRVNNVVRAIDESFPAAFHEITKKLRGISIDSIKSILRDMLTDVALYLGGSTVLGTGIGGGIGSLAGGIGAIPGAMVGGWLGFELGNVIMVLTGLKSVAVFMKDALPAAVRCYGLGFKEAWGEPTDKAPWASFAWKRIAQGHVLFLMALLMGIVAYLTRGKGDFGALLAEVRASKKLGPKMADWIEANKDDLLKNPELQPKASAGGGGAEKPSEPPPANRPPPRPSAPGAWKQVNEAMSDRARAYQTQIGGRTNEAYFVNGTKFDGINDAGTLLDAKGPGYAKFVDSSGRFQPWFDGADDFVNQAERQIRAAGGNPIEWHFAESEAAAATQRLFSREGINEINVVVTPPVN